MNRSFFIFVLALASTAISVFADSPRERLSLDAGWKFFLGDNWGNGEKLDKAGAATGAAGKKFNDTNWRTLDLPHDWVVELPFDEKADNFHGSKPVGPGYGTNSVGWYRRTFTLGEADRGKKIWLEFDGVYRDSRVFVNGYRLAHHESGYNSFRCDITDVANCGGENIVAVRVDASEFEGWFYEGAGIYRHVWLEKTAPLAVAPDGIFVFSQFENNVPGGKVSVVVKTEIANAQGKDSFAIIAQEIFGLAGESVGKNSQTVKVSALANGSGESKIYFSNPSLWSPESPKLYKLVTTISEDGKVADRTETEFGIRTVAFDADKGFLLNGKPYTIKGTCNHQDHAGVGSALPDALQNFRMAKLKEMGCNAIRTSHHEPTAELLAACDRLGLLVMDENRALGSDDQNLAALAQHIRRDRNHPSVFIWSLANEEYFQRTATGARIFETMQNLVHRLDPTRLCTAAMNSWSGGRPDGFSTVMDVQGFNYLNNGDMDAFNRSNPHQFAIGTEEASAFYTRGNYENSATYKSAYDDNKPGYGATAEEWWKFYAARPWASGAFVWTGFDYRGEPSPFGWPNISSEFGILDTCGFPKDVFYYYQSWWTDKPVLHLMPHWNWPGKEGQTIDVRAFSNCEEVELFLNGTSLGKKMMPKNSHLQWPVKYAPGTLSAKGFNHGQLVAETKVETTGAPAAIQLIADRETIHADGADCSVLTVAVTDEQGRIVPDADKLVHFELSGAGKILGVGNGDPISHEADVFVSLPAVRSIALDNWRMKKVSDTKDRPEVAENFDDTKWHHVDVTKSEGPLHTDESAVFRAHISLTAEDLVATNAVLNFGMIDDEGWVYVNGQFAGESHDWQVDPYFDAKKFLRAGDNVVAVAVKNHENNGGVNKGVALELAGPPVAPGWQRCTFNGLAQIIVQASTDGGEIGLIATADGLKSKTISLRAEPCGELKVLSAK